MAAMNTFTEKGGEGVSQPGPGRPSAGRPGSRFRYLGGSGSSALPASAETEAPSQHKGTCPNVVSAPAHPRPGMSPFGSASGSVKACFSAFQGVFKLFSTERPCLQKRFLNGAGTWRYLNQGNICTPWFLQKRHRLMKRCIAPISETGQRSTQLSACPSPRPPASPGSSWKNREAGRAGVPSWPRGADGRVSSCPD